jgi:hypothetical protein
MGVELVDFQPYNVSAEQTTGSMYAECIQKRCCSSYNETRECKAEIVTKTYSSCGGRLALRVLEDDEKGRSVWRLPSSCGI